MSKGKWMGELLSDTGRTIDLPGSSQSEVCHLRTRGPHAVSYQRLFQTIEDKVNGIIDHYEKSFDPAELANLKKISELCSNNPDYVMEETEIGRRFYNLYYGMSAPEMQKNSLLKPRKGFQKEHPRRVEPQLLPEPTRLI